MAPKLTTNRTKADGRAQPSGAARPLARDQRTRVLFAASTLVVVFDQATKLWGHHSAKSPLTEPVHNPELALGIVGGSQLALASAMIIALVIFGGFLFRRMNQGRIPPLTVALLAGGAVGNIIDRVLIGAVRDFIPTPWAVFNVADIALVAGAIGYLFFATAKGRHSISARSKTVPLG